MTNEETRKENTGAENDLKQSAPKKRLGITTSAAIVTAGVIIGLAILLTNGAPSVKNDQITTETESFFDTLQAPPQKVSVRADDAVRGNIGSAEIVVIEYSDSDCPFCERFHVSMKDIISSSPVSVAWVYRHFPLSIHPNAENESVALECVKELGGNDAFWTYLDSVIGMTFSPDRSAPLLTTLAKDVGVDSQLFSSCISSGRKQQIVKAQSEEAQSLGARGTPFSIMINTKTNEQLVIPGAAPKELLIEAFQQFIAE